jgi:hypothetical protein
MVWAAALLPTSWFDALVGRIIGLDRVSLPAAA